MLVESLQAKLSLLMVLQQIFRIPSDSCFSNAVEEVVAPTVLRCPEAEMGG